MESEFTVTLIPVLLLLLSTATLIVLCLRCRHRNIVSLNQVKEETSALEEEASVRAVRCRSSEIYSGLLMESNQNAFIYHHVSTEKPGKPQASSVSHDSIQLEWTKPEQDDCNNIASYTIFYRSNTDASNQWMQQEAKSAIEEATVSKLSENGIYTFKVRPELKNGHHGPESDESEPIQTAMIIPSKPGQPIILNITHDSVELEWSKPEQGAHNVISYSILYHSSSDMSDTGTRVLHESKAIEGKVTATISDLSENSTYVFKVRPESVGGKLGPESDESEPVRTKVIIPSKPGQPTAVKVTDNSIELIWSKPEQGAQNIMSYTVFYHSKSDPANNWSEIITAYEKVTLLNLCEKTTYVTKVCPTCIDGVGGESDVSKPIQTFPHLSEKNIFELAWDARVKWYHIGIQLGQKTTNLDVIGKEKDDDTCFTRMIIEWLRKGKATWDELIDALNHKTVGFSGLADIIADNCLVKDCSNAQVLPPSIAKPIQFAGVGFRCPLCSKCSMEEYYKGKCPKLDSPTDLAFPYLATQYLTENERINLHARLTQDTEDIRKEFNNLLEKVRESFNNQDIDLQKMIESIEDILSLSSLPMETSKTNSASAIIRHLQQKKYISFFNCSVVQTLIAKHGTDDDKKMLSAYEAKFKKFCQRSVFEVPPTIFRPPPDNDQMLAFKVTDEVPRHLHEIAADISVPPSYSTVETSSKTLKLSLNDTLNIQIMIAKKLGIENFGSLIFLGAQEGCIELRFLIHEVTLDRIKQQQKVKTLIELPGFAALESDGIHILCGSPGKPYATDTTNHSIHLQWKQPEYLGQIEYYRVHYISLNDPSAGWKSIQSNGCVESLEIGGLSQNQSPFIFKVQAVNAIGAGIQSEKSDPIHLRSLPIKQSNLNIGKPGKPQALNITHDSIQLEWTKPDKYSNSITSYTILYHSTHDPPYQWMIQRHVNNTEEIAIVSQLLENTTYRFQIQPEFEAGIGLQSDISDPIMTKRIIPSKPGKPRALKITHQGIEIEWSKPEQGAHNVTCYSVLYHSTSDPTDYWTVYEATTIEERATVSQLRESTTYYFKIQPQYADGDGLVGDVSDPISTELITPSQPGRPQCTGAGYDYIQIEWSEPEQGAHNITSYTILCRSITSDPPDAWMQQRVKSTEKSSTVLGLSEDTVYLFKVRPDCGDTFGSESDTSEPIATKKRSIVPRKLSTSTVSFKVHDIYKLSRFRVTSTLAYVQGIPLVG